MSSYTSIQTENAKIQETINKIEAARNTRERDTLYIKEQTDFANTVLNAVFVIYYIIYIFLSIYIFYYMPELYFNTKIIFVVVFFIFPLIVGFYTTYFSNKINIGLIGERFQYNVASLVVYVKSVFYNLVGRLFYFL